MVKLREDFTKLNLAMIPQSPAYVLEDNDWHQEVSTIIGELAMLRTEVKLIKFPKVGSRSIAFPKKTGYMAYEMGGNTLTENLITQRSTYEEAQMYLRVPYAKATWGMPDLETSNVDLLAEEAKSVGQAMIDWENNYLWDTITAIDGAGETPTQATNGVLDYDAIVDAVCNVVETKYCKPKTKRLLLVHPTNMKTLLKDERVINRDYTSAKEVGQFFPQDNGQFLTTIGEYNTNIYVDFGATENEPWLVDAEQGVKGAERLPITTQRIEENSGLTKGFVSWEMIGLGYIYPTTCSKITMS